MKKFFFLCVWIEWWYNHEHEVAGFLSLSLSFSLCPTRREEAFILCPTDSYFFSLSLTR